MEKLKRRKQSYLRYTTSCIWLHEHTLALKYEAINTRVEISTEKLESENRGKGLNTTPGFFVRSQNFQASRLNSLDFSCARALTGAIIVSGMPEHISGSTFRAVLRRLYSQTTTTLLSKETKLDRCSMLRLWANNNAQGNQKRHRHSTALMQLH